MRNSLKRFLPFISYFISLVVSLLFWIFQPDCNIKLWVLALVASVLIFVFSTIIFFLWSALNDSKERTTFVISKVIKSRQDEDGYPILICADPLELYNINSMASVFETMDSEAENFLCTAVVVNRTDKDLVYFKLMPSERLSVRQMKIIDQIKGHDVIVLKNLLIKPTISITEFNKGENHND